MPQPLSPTALTGLTPLPRAFYQRDTVAVARDLLGKLLVRRLPDGLAALRLVEVEAYLGTNDPAAHTSGGRRTPRNETMWGEAGHLYVYFVYGMHHCCNVVTGGPGTPEAVLLRGGLAVCGEPLMAIRRRRRSGIDLASGPGKLCASLDIDRGLDGLDLTTTEAVWVADDGWRAAANSIAAGPRIGVAYAGEAAAWPLRFTVPGACRRGGGPRRAAGPPGADSRRRGAHPPRGE